MPGGILDNPLVCRPGLLAYRIFHACFHAVIFAIGLGSFIIFADLSLAVERYDYLVWTLIAYTMLFTWYGFAVAMSRTPAAFRETHYEDNQLYRQQQQQQQQPLLVGERHAGRRESRRVRVQQCAVDMTAAVTGAAGAAAERNAATSAAKDAARQARGREIQEMDSDEPCSYQSTP